MKAISGRCGGPVCRGAASRLGAPSFGLASLVSVRHLAIGTSSKGVYGHISLQRRATFATSNNSRKDETGMAVVFLGTGSSVPSLERNTSAIAVKLDRRLLLFDCGEATQHQFIKCPGLTCKHVEHIFITHLHGDHVLGLPGVIHEICCASSLLRTEPLHVYGPQGLRRFVQAVLATTRPAFEVPIFVHELIPPDTKAEGPPKNGRERNIMMDPATNTWDVFHDDKVSIKAAMLRHKVPCWGYVLQEAETEGNINAELCTARGLQPGPLYKQLKAGQPVTLPDGTLLHPSEVVGPPKPGRKLVILGDTCDSSNIAEIGKNADILIHESTLPRRLAPETIKRGHSTAGAFAKRINAKKLILTHFSIRSDVLGEESPEDMVKDAARVFGGPVVAAHDLMWEHVAPKQPKMHA